MGHRVFFTYKTLASHYSAKAPKGFKEFSSANGVTQPNTCAVRLGYALFSTDRAFFTDVTAKSRTEWYGIPTRASDLAIVLNQKLGKAVKTTISSLQGRTGIVFFDTIPGFEGTGHISLWDGGKVVDAGDYRSVSPRTYFWEI